MCKKFLYLVLGERKFLGNIPNQRKFSLVNGSEQPNNWQVNNCTSVMIFLSFFYNLRHTHHLIQPITHKEDTTVRNAKRNWNKWWIYMASSAWPLFMFDICHMLPDFNWPCYLLSSFKANHLINKVVRMGSSWHKFTK